MSHWKIILITLLITTVLVSGCQPGNEPEVVCDPPQIISGEDCCMDLNDDGLCDENTPDIGPPRPDFPETISNNSTNASSANTTSEDPDDDNRESLKKIYNSTIASSPNNRLRIIQLDVTEVGFDTHILESLVIYSEIPGTLRIEMDSEVRSHARSIEVQQGRNEAEVDFGITELEYPRTLHLELSNEEKISAVITKEINFTQYRDEYDFNTLKECESLEEAALEYKCKGIISGNRGNNYVCEALRESSSKTEMYNQAWCAYGYVSVTGDMRYCDTIETWREKDLLTLREKCKDIARIKR